MIEKYIIKSITIASVLLTISCSNKVSPKKEVTLKPVAKEIPQVFPVSDSLNTGGWVYKPKISDEFDGSELDRKKWHVVGELDKNGVPHYDNPDKPYKGDWIGRAPSQFSGDNYRLENGMVKLETRWEPDFKFSDKVDRVGGKDVKHENITTACLIMRREFLYGYMEIRCKAADAEISSAFWATGKGTEFDMFEFFGDHRQPKKEKDGKDKELWWSIHDWTKKGGPTTYTEYKFFDFRVADDFHVYGYDWSENGVKIYVDGKLFRDVTRDQINQWDDSQHKRGGNGIDVENYVITKPVKIWLDQETFPWHGYPDSKEDLHPSGKVDYQVDYVRVWQKK